jgi:AcrR family transcriptional regulator
MAPPSNSRTRPPLQERTREGWARILSTGLELLKEGGWEALTIAEVCRRARVTAPSIYARVDGRAGLFEAVYEYGMLMVAETERDAFRLSSGNSDDDTVGRVVSAVVHVFVTHEALLREVIRYSSSNASLLARGSMDARRVTSRVAAALPVANETGRLIGRVLFSECLMRVLYGEGFYLGGPEPVEVFVAKLTRIARALMSS